MRFKFLLCLALIFSGSLFGLKCAAAIVYPKAPYGGQQLAMSFINSIVRKNPQFLGLGSTNGVTLARPIPWCAMNLLTTQLTSLFEPKQNWVYIIRHGSNFVGTVSLVSDTAGKALRFNSLSQGSKGGYPEVIVKALRLAEQWPQVQTNDYTVGLIAGNMRGIWLHNESNDIVIPLPPTYDRVIAYQPYTVSEIIKIFAPEAKRDAQHSAEMSKQENEDNAAYTKAMNDFEKAHGGGCGAITLYGESAPLQNLAPHVVIFTLMGKSRICGEVQYKAKVTYQNQYDGVKDVEILEKLPNKTH